MFNDGTVASSLINKLLKDTRRQIKKDEPTWGWYQPCSISNSSATNSFPGELSILGSKSETSPITFPKYPVSDPPLEMPGNITKVIPKFEENFRRMTTRTKIRIAFELYYKFPTETHLYQKREKRQKQLHNNDGEVIYDEKKALIISITDGRAAFKSQKIANAARSALESFSSTTCYHTDTIALELGKQASSMTNETTEDIFKLLINWRESFFDVEILIIIGLQDCVKISVDLLDALINRKSFPKLWKSGLVLMEGSVTSYSLIDIIKLDQLLYTNNTKISIVGSLQTIPGSLALPFKHPNIHRSLFIPVINEAHDAFKVQLFKMLLISVNLGKDHLELSKRLILQISKYFNHQQHRSITTTTTTTTSKNNDAVSPQTKPSNANSTATTTSNQTTISLSFINQITSESFSPILTHQLHSTSLFRRQHLQQLPIQTDEILENKYNLIWNLHAFLDEFKKLPNIDANLEIDALLSSFKSWDSFLNGGGVSNNVPPINPLTNPPPLKSNKDNNTKIPSSSLNQSKPKSSKTGDAAKKIASEDISKDPPALSKSDKNGNRTNNANAQVDHQNLNVANTVIDNEERELCQMLEVLKIEDYSACLFR